MKEVNEKKNIFSSHEKTDRILISELYGKLWN